MWLLREHREPSARTYCTHTRAQAPPPGAQPATAAWRVSTVTLLDAASAPESAAVALEQRRAALMEREGALQQWALGLQAAAARLEATWRHAQQEQVEAGLRGHLHLETAATLTTHTHTHKHEHTHAQRLRQQQAEAVKRLWRASEPRAYTRTKMCAHTCTYSHTRMV